MRVVTFGAGVALCIAGGVQSWYAPAMLLWVPGVILILGALYARREQL